MSLPLILSALWVLAAAGTALLPMRRQYFPGIALLLAAPGLVVWLGVVHGPVIGLLALAGVVSMFRNPLRYFYRLARGEKPEVPR